MELSEIVEGLDALEKKSTATREDSKQALMLVDEAQKLEDKDLSSRAAKAHARAVGLHKSSLLKKLERLEAKESVIAGDRERAKEIEEETQELLEGFELAAKNIRSRISRESAEEHEELFKELTAAHDEARPEGKIVDRQSENSFMDKLRTLVYSYQALAAESDAALAEAKDMRSVLIRASLAENKIRELDNQRVLKEREALKAALDERAEKEKSEIKEIVKARNERKQESKVNVEE